MAALRQSVVIYARGQSGCRVIVPAFEPQGDDVVAEALEVARSLFEAPSDQITARVFQTEHVVDVESKS